MTLYLIRNCTIVDARARQPRPGHDVLVDRGRIRAVSAQPIAARPHGSRLWLVLGALLAIAAGIALALVLVGS